MQNKENNNKKQTDKPALRTTVHSLSHDGRGIATIDDKATFIPFTLPEETITYQLTKKHRSYNEAKLITLEKAAETRVTPPCEHFGLCGGCSLQHMAIATQMALKETTLLDQLAHFGKVAPEEILPALHANDIGYRRKARLGVKYVYKKEKILVGFREKASRYLADLKQCEVLHPNVGHRFQELSTLIRSLDAYDKIAQIEVAMGDTETALVFRHLIDLSESDLDKLIAFAKETQIHIYLQPNPPAKVHRIWPTEGPERITYSLPDANVTFQFHPMDFTQVNLEMNRLMVNQALSHLDLSADDRVLDLFCGIGNFSLPIARHAKHITGVEGSNEMVERAYENAKANILDNVSFYAANLQDENLSAKWLAETYDKILLDPPRTGAKEIIPHLAKCGAKRIVYISCNPATLARDAGELVHKHKYKLKAAGIMNMFPHTAHIEAMAVFEH